ncbi:hypothetical protein O6H91_15G050300 [Diphasiastrum complanatum]|uniref:Uncharacterized protein n=1 Tax=Diphasiastrum complanatum TaxID=34168 RepID=A0ACC2BI46_DIPCM|nr:hypothetical protein O6H91_15G050300 [Diphasiastrum complanatum]
MATNATEREIFEELRGFVHVWSQRRWKQRFIILYPGRLEVFLSDEKAKKTVQLQGCNIDEAGRSKSEKFDPVKSSLSFQLWIKLRRRVSFDEKLYQGTILTIEPVKGKKLLILVSKEETVKWRAAIEKAASLEGSLQHEAKASKVPDGSCSKRRTRSERSSGGILAKRNLQLRRPWSLTWEATTAKDNIANLTSGNEVEASEDNEYPGFLTSTQLESLWFELETFQGCTDFLKSNCLNAQALAYASLMIDHFKGCYQMGDSSLPDELRLEAWRGTLRRLIKTLVDHLLENNPTLESCQIHQEHMEQLWLACEVWVAGAVYDKIMGACKQMFSVKDKQLDQILAKLEKASPSLLGVRPEFTDFVLGDALQQFRMINMFHTPLEKAVCLRKTVNLIMDGIQRVTQSCSGALAQTDGLLPCTDDLLSFMLLLMARAKVKYLQANACYMQKFLFVQEEDYQRGELGYHITNFVAACEYLLSAEIQKIVADVIVAPTAATLNRTEILQGIGYEASNHSKVGPTMFTYGSSPRSIKALDRSLGEITDSPQQLHSFSTSNGHSRLPNNTFERLAESPPYQMNSSRSDSLNGHVCGVKGQASLSLGGDDVGSPKWIRDNYQVKKEETLMRSTRMTSQKPVLALPGSSPEFILSPTYV